MYAGRSDWEAPLFEGRRCARQLCPSAEVCARARAHLEQLRCNLASVGAHAFHPAVLCSDLVGRFQRVFDLQDPRNTDLSAMLIPS